MKQKARPDTRTPGRASVIDGVVTFVEEDDTLLERIITVHKAMEESALDQSYTHMPLVFSHDGDSYIVISDGKPGIHEYGYSGSDAPEDALIQLVGIDGGAATDQLNIVDGSIVGLL